ncbi:leucine-rich repeat-containing protein 40 [Nilaparvata lugens]|uniref:leucine-rich repeat-containing protein 40 n=1 Tax=Nilaparvata lugens TaxID=108931 RepID=UPI00193E6752|nr:leucine-rich repeat-containing protein 40 [Nilaparvata lugens]
MEEHCTITEISKLSKKDALHRDSETGINYLNEHKCGVSDRPTSSLQKKMSGQTHTTKRNVEMRNICRDKARAIFDDRKRASLLGRNLKKCVRIDGTLNLSNQNLSEVPQETWSVDLLDETEKQKMIVDFSNSDDELKWWEFKPLQNLNLSHNSIKVLPKELGILEVLIELNVENNQIEELPKEIGQLQHLKTLKVKMNRLKSVPEELFKLKEIVHLDLSENLICEIHEGLGDLVTLQKLDLSRNKLSAVPLSLGYLTSLVTLNISHNHLASVPEEIQNLRGLTDLDISHNNISELPPMTHMSHLTIIEASCNQIAEVPAFNNCRKLREVRFGQNKIEKIEVGNFEEVPVSVLILSSNQILEVPEDIARLTTLTILDLSKNSITNIPPIMTRLRKLTHLKLEGNPIKNIRQDILKTGTLRLLDHLSKKLKDEIASQGNPNNAMHFYDACYSEESDVMLDKQEMRSGNLILCNSNMAKIPEEIISQAQDAKILSVDLSKNNFTIFPDNITALQATLSELDLKFNFLEELPSCIGQLSQLQFLNLSHNKLTTLPNELNQCLRMREILLESNRLSEIPDVIHDLTHLERLDVAGNSINEINVDRLGNLKRLYYLNVSCNNIQKIPCELGKLEHIKELMLFGNPFRCPRQAILAKGTAAVMQFLRDRLPENSS